MVVGRSNSHKSKPLPPPCPLCSFTGHIAKGCRQYTVIKKDRYPPGNRAATATTVTTVCVIAKTPAAAPAKHPSTKGRHHAEDKHELIQAEYYFCERPHRSDDCLYRAESTDAPAESQQNHFGFIYGVRSNFGTGIIASVGRGSLLTANITTQLALDQC